jgi:putative membrane protein
MHEVSTVNDLISARPILASLIFAAIGILLLVFAFWIIDKLTPHNLWKEIVEKGNVALAILAGSFLIAIGMIVSASIHG